MKIASVCLSPTITLGSFLSRHITALQNNRLLTGDKTSLVLMSNSRCIFENLAAEEAFLRGVLLLPPQRFLFLYVNEPCVVIGRNQNFLQEVAVSSARRDGVAIVRRNSGGGAVFHDEGNICLSFFSHRGAYQPAKSIQLLRLFLCCELGIEHSRLTTTSRHDLFLDGMKISGSAMRVQRDVAYHHCTLLVSSSLRRLGAYLFSEGQHVSFASFASRSNCSPVTTLKNAGVFSGRLQIDGDVVLQTKKLLADFFVRYADTILSHSAPWELHPSELICVNEQESVNSGEASKRNLCREKTQPQDDGVFVLDVVGALRENTSIVDGDGRKTYAGFSTTMQEEVARLRSYDWLFSMPKFETRVAITLKELAECKTGVVSSFFGFSCISPAVIACIMEHHTCVDITTVVEQRRVTSVTASWVDEAAGELSEARWCTCILQLLLEGTNLDDVSVDISEKNGVLLAALQLECYEIIKSLSTLLVSSASDGDKCIDGQALLCRFLAILLDLWRTKNVFDLY